MLTLHDVSRISGNILLQSLWRKGVAASVLLGALSLGAAPAFAKDDLESLRKQAIERYASEPTGECQDLDAALSHATKDAPVPTIYTVRPQRVWTEEGREPAKVTVFEFLCSLGAYNASSIYLIKTDYSFVWASFPRPNLKVDYADQEQREMRSIAISGYQSSNTVTNANFDPKTGVLEEFSKWRGLGDAWHSARYQLTETGFLLKSYEADVTYDEAADAQFKRNW